jgi:hypothetical protein
MFLNTCDPVFGINSGVFSVYGMIALGTSS